MGDKKPINPDQLRINVEFMRKEIAEGKMSQETLTDIRQAPRGEPQVTRRQAER